MITLLHWSSPALDVARQDDLESDDTLIETSLMFQRKGERRDSQSLE